jgi:hypothetical protein
MTYVCIMYKYSLVYHVVCYPPPPHSCLCPLYRIYYMYIHYAEGACDYCSDTTQMFVLITIMLHNISPYTHIILAKS